MRAGIAASAGVLPIAVQLEVVRRVLHDHQSHVMLGVVIYGIRVQKALVLGQRPSGLVIAAQSERRTRGQIVRQGLALRNLQAVNQRCARCERQIAVLHLDRGGGRKLCVTVLIAADHDRVSLYRHAAAGDLDPAFSVGRQFLTDRSVFQRHAAAGDGQRDLLYDIGINVLVDMPCLPVQVNGKRAARDGDVFRHIPRQRHRAAAAGRCRVDGCLQRGVLLPAVLRRLSYTADTISVLPEGVLLISGSPATTLAAYFVGQTVVVGGGGQGVILCARRPADAGKGVAFSISRL